MSYPTFPFTKQSVSIQPQARSCMQKLHISKEEVVTTINELESGDVIATDPLTGNTLAAYPETADEIPAFYISERTFPERNLTISAYYSTSIKTQRGKRKVSAVIHWLSAHPPLDPIIADAIAADPNRDWLEPKEYKN